MEKMQIRVLLIEDNPADVLFLREGLAKDTLADFDLTVVESLTEALETQPAQNFSAALLDLGLPDSTGLDTFLKLHRAAPDLPVVVLSALDNEDVAMLAMQAGAQDYMVKRPQDLPVAGRALRYAVERQKSQKTLRESEQRFFTLFHSNPVPVGVTRASDYKIVDVNEAWEKMTGYTRAEALGKTSIELGLARADTLFGVRAKLSADGEIRNSEIPLYARSGDERNVLISSEQIVLDGQPYYLNTLLDITERKQAEQKLRENEARQSFLLNINDETGPVADPVELQGIVARNTLDYFKADRCYYCEITDGYAFIHRDTSRGDLPSVAGRYLMSDFPIFNRVVEAGNPFVVDDIHSTDLLDEPLRQLCIQLQLISFLDIPVIKNGEPVGILCITQCTEREWTNFEVDLSREIAERTWEAVERKRAEQNLRERESQLQALVTSLDDIVFEVDEGGTYLNLWTANEAILFRSREQVIGKRFDEVFGEQANRPFFEYLERVLKSNEPDVLEYPVEIAGSQRWFAARFNPIRTKDHSRRTVSILVRDITERRQAEDKLHESETLLRQVLENTQDAMFVIDHDYRLLINNQRHQEVVVASGGHPFEVGESIFAPDYPPEMLEYWRGLYDRAMQGEIFSIELSWTDIHGKPRFYENIFSPMCNAGNEIIGALIVAHNITERKQAELSLREKLKLQEQLEKTASIVPGMIHIFKQDASGKYSMPYASPAFQDVYGLEAAEVANDMSPAFANIDLQDVPHIQATIAESARTMEPWRDEFRYHHPQKGLRWLSGHSTPVAEPDGSILWYGIIEDVTERKQIEVALAVSENRLKGVIDSAMDGIISANGDLKVVLFNETAEKMFGIPAKEAIGQPLNRFIPDRYQKPHKRHMDGLNADIIRSIPAGHIFSIVGKRSNGEEFPAESSISYVETGSEKLFTAILRDVTERKKAEEKLRESEEFLKESQRIAKMGSWRLDLSTFKLAWSENGYRLFGFEPGEVEPTFDLFKQMVHPDDLQLVEEASNSLLQHPRPLEYEYRIVDKHGSVKWLYNSMMPVMEGDRAVQFTGIQIDVTERKQTEAKMRASEENFRQIAETINEVFWIFDNQQQRMVYLNPAFEKIWGTSIEDAYQDTSKYILGIHPDDHPIMFAALERQARGERSQMEYRIVQPDGSIRWIFDRSFPILAEDGQVVRTTGVATDITERKQAETLLNRRMEDLSLINKLNDAVNRGESLVTITELLAEHTKKMFGSLSASIYLLDRDKKRLVLQHFTMPAATVEKLEKVLGRAVPQIDLPIGGDDHFSQVLRADKGVVFEGSKEVTAWLADFANTSILPEKVRPVIRKTVPAAAKLLKIQSVISIPLSTGDGPLGLIELTSEGTFDENVIERLENVRQQLTEVIIHKQLQEALHESEEQYRSLVESLDSVVVTMDTAGTVRYINKVAAKIWNVTTAEIIGKAMDELFPPEYAKLQLAAVHQVIQTNQAFVYDTQSFIQGQSHWYHASIQPIHNEAGQVSQVLINATDIHDLKTTQHELETLNLTLEERVKQRTAEVQDLYDNAPTGYHSLDTNGCFTQVNLTELNWLGYAREEVIGHPVSEFLAPDSLSTFRQNFPTFKKTGVLRDLELDFICRDGSILPTLVNAIAVYDADGNYLMSRSTIFDNTERKKAEDALRASETRFNFLLTQTPAMIFTAGLTENTPITFISKSVSKILGYSPDDYARNPSFWLELIHPDDLSNMSQISRDLAEKGNALWEARTRCADGEYRWMSTGVSLVQDDEGRPLEFIGYSVNIDSTKKAEEALRESQANLQYFFDTASDLIQSMDENGRYLYVNAAWSKTLGYTTEEAQTLRMLDVIEPSHHAHCRAMLESLIIDQHPQQLEVVFRTKQGEEVVVEGSVSSRKDKNGHIATNGIFRNITERKRAEEALRQSEETYRALFESANDGIFIFNIDNIVQRTNPHGSEMLGYSPEEMIGKVGYDFVGQENIKDAVDRWQRIVEGENLPAYERKLLRKDGTWLDSEINLSLIRDVSGKPKYIQSVVRDISARKQAEETLRVANAELERALRMKDEFLANMSHELRTPLNAILGFSESLLEETAGPLNEKQSRYLGTISESGRHLLDLINDILDLAKVEAGQIKLEIRNVSVLEVCEASLRLIKQLAHHKNQIVNLEIASEAVLIRADERRLKQMIVNLLSNAVKYTPKNGKLGLQVQLNKENAELLITVWDQGIGISEEGLKLIFQPFVQLDSSLARESSGTGLGLVLVAEMSRLHGGSISVESKAGQGSRFTIHLPWDETLVEDQKEIKKDTGRLSLGNQSALQSRRRILLVEDTEHVVMMIKDYLENSGYQVDTVSNGLEAVARVGDLHPDLILMDVQLPGMDGLEATRRIRLDENMSRVPIIALTALAMPSDRERCLAAGMNEYISKPVNLKSLVRTIQTFLPGYSVDKEG